MEQYKIELTQQAKDNLTETIDTLMQAAQEIANSTEQDFNEMKSKKWYKRLWELVTCSKNNQKTTARGVTNLAKLTEIIMKAIVLLANHSEETAKLVSEALNNIENLEGRLEELSVNFKKLALEVKKLKYNYKKSLSLENLKAEERDIVGSIFAKYTRLCYANGIMPNDASRNLYAFAMEGDIIEEDIDVSTHLDKLNPDVQKLLYRLNQSYYYLIAGDFDDSEYFDDFSVSVKDIKMIRKQIEEAVIFSGAENYAKTLVPDDTLYIIDGDGLIFEEEEYENTAPETAEVPESNNIPEFVLDNRICFFNVCDREGSIVSCPGHCDHVIEENEVVSVFDNTSKEYLGDARITKIEKFGSGKINKTKIGELYVVSIDTSNLFTEMTDDGMYEIHKKKDYVADRFKGLNDFLDKTEVNDKKDNSFDAKLRIFKNYIYDIVTVPSSVEIGGHNKKVRNAISTFASHIDEDEVLGFYDSTVLGSGKAGFLFTETGMIFKDMGSSGSFDYDEILNITTTSAKKDSEKTIKITLNNMKTIEITCFGLNKTPLLEFLEEMRGLC